MILSSNQAVYLVNIVVQKDLGKDVCTYRAGSSGEYLFLDQNNEILGISTFLLPTGL